MEKVKYNGNALDVLKSKRFISVITGVLVAGLVTIIPELEAHREQLYGLIALVFGGLAMGYNIEDWIEAAMRVIAGEPLPDSPEDIFKDIENGNEGNPDDSDMPDSPTLFEPVKYTFDTLGTKRVWTNPGKHPHADIEIPKDFDYQFVPHKDSDGNDFPNKALNTDAQQQHTRLNIAWLAGVYYLDYQKPIAVTPGKYTIELVMNATINTEAARDPYYNWIAVHCKVDGERIGNVDFEKVSHANPSDGQNVFQWHYEANTSKVINIGFVTQVHNPYAQGDSTLDFKAWSIQKKIS